MSLYTGRAPLTNRAASPARYALDPAFKSLVRADLQARVDGLNHHLDAVYAAIRCRLVDEDGPALARTLTFAGRPEDVEALAESLVQALRAGCGEVDDRAQQTGAAQRTFAVALALAPLDPKEDAR